MSRWVMATVVRPYRGVSAEERRSQRRGQLLQACLDTVAESGVAAVTAEAVCTRAGLSKRYFYESFSDRDAVLVAALDEFFTALRAALVERLAGCATMAGRVECVARVLVRLLASDRRMARLYVEAHGSTALAARRRELVDEFTPFLVSEVLDDDPSDPGAQAATVLMVAGTIEVLDRWLRGDLELSEEQVTSSLAALGTAIARTVTSG